MPTNSTTNRIPLSYVLAVMYVGVAFIQASPQGPQITQLLALSPHAVKSGEIWRLATYVFLYEGGLIWLIFKAMIAVFICLPLETLWGRGFFLFVFWGATILGGLTATLFNMPLMGDGALSLSLMLIHGLLFPLSQISLFFIFQVKVKHLAILFSALFLLSLASQGIVPALTAFAGLFSGVGLWLLGKKMKWDRPGKISPPHLPKIPNKEARTKKDLHSRSLAIISTVKKERTLSAESSAWIDQLDKETSFNEEICAPFSFDPKGQRCNSCQGYTICLKRDTLLQTQEIINPSED